MGVKSLVELCTRVAMDNISRIESLQNMPTRAVQEILTSVRTSTQLRALEENDEEIPELTAPHWRRLIRRDFPLLEKQYNWVPKVVEEWHKVYKKYETLQRQQDEAATAKLQQAFAAKKKEAVSRHASLVSFKDTWKLPRLPKDGGSSFGVRGQSSGSSGGGGSSSGWGSSSSRPKEGKGFLQKARREARDLHNRHVSAVSSRMGMTSRIARAPQAMLDAKRIERQFDPVAAHANAPTIRAPRALSARTDREEHERRQKESRLLSIKNGGQPTPGNVVSFDDEEDEEDDIFGDKQPNSSRASKMSPPSSPDDFSTSPRKPGLKRRPGLLSASPGANKSGGTTTRTVQSRLSNPDTAPSSSTATFSASGSSHLSSQAINPRPSMKSGALSSGSSRADQLPSGEPLAGGLSAADRAALDRMKRKPSSTSLFLPKNKRSRF